MNDVVPVPEARRESPAGVLGVAVALAFVGLAVLVILGARTRTLAGEEVLAEHFEVGPLPFGFEVLEASALPDGQQVVVLGDPAHPPPPPVESPGGGGDWGGGRGGDDSSEDEESYDWAAVAEGEAGTPPQFGTLIVYPLDQGERILRRQFGSLSFRDISEIEADGGRSAVDSGTLEWGPYTTEYVRERRFRKEGEEGRIRDVMRVNLSTRDACRVLYLMWPEGLPGSKERLQEMVAALGLRVG